MRGGQRRGASGPDRAAGGAPAAPGPVLAPEGTPTGVLLGLAAVLALAWWAYRPLLSLGHLGWDTWPLILTSRIVTPGDWLGTFRERLMDGIYPHGDFYRPMLNLSIALDYALWQTRPLGYHLTDLLLLLLSTGAVFGVSRRLLGDPWAALAAGALFALHPLHFESLPATARRGDALAGLFTLLALWTLPRPGHGRGAAAAVCALAAPLLALLAFVEAPGSVAARARAGLRVAAPALVLLVVFLGLRGLVLGGLGGHVGTSLASGLWRTPRLALLFLPLLAVPQPAGALPGLAGLALLLLLGAVLAWVAPPGSRVRRVLPVPLAWGGLLLVLSGASGDLAPWYAPTLLPAHALVFAALVAALHGGWRSAPVARRVAGTAVALLLALVPLRYSGLFERYAQWYEIGAESDAFLADLHRRIAALPPEGGRVSVSGLPERQPRGSGVGVHGAAGLGVYSLRAWAALELPDRRVVVATEPPATRETGVVVVVVEAAPPR